MDKIHWHGEYRHEHDKGDVPHSHDLTDEETEVLEGETIDPPTVSESMDENMESSVEEGYYESDENDIDASLRKEFNTVASKALRKDAIATQEALDAGRTARASEEPGVPPEVALDAQNKLADALKHKSQAQNMAQLAMQIGDSITTPVDLGEGNEIEEITPIGQETEIIEDGEIEGEVEPEPEIEVESRHVARNKSAFRLGKRRYG